MNAANPVIKCITPSRIVHPIVVSSLPPLDRIKFILYQLIYANYLDLINMQSKTSNGLIAEYIEYVKFLVKTIPAADSRLNDTEKQIYNFIKNVIEKFDPQIISWSVIDEALTFPGDNSSSTIVQMQPTKEFYIPLLQALGFGYPKDIYISGKMTNPILLLPSIAISHADPNNPFMYIELRELTLLDYDFTLAGKNNFNFYFSTTVNVNNLFCYLAQFNFSNFDLNGFIGILASFSLEHGRYVSTYPDFYQNGLITDACYDVITQSDTLDNNLVNDYHAFLKCIDILYNYHRIGNLENTEVFSLLVSKFNVPNKTELSSYFSKSNPNMITGKEALAFKNSVFKHSWFDKLNAFYKGTEAITNDDDDGSAIIDPVDTSAIDQDNTLDNFGTTEDMSAESTSDADKKLKRDPKKLLLELAKPNESFTDYNFRALVKARIHDFLTNPSKQVPSKELVLLKNWSNSWVNLLSITAIRDYLSRLSFELMDIEQN